MAFALGGCGDDQVETASPTSASPAAPPLCPSIDTYVSGTNGREPTTISYAVLACPPAIPDEEALSSILSQMTVDPASVRSDDDDWWRASGVTASEAAVAIGPFDAFIELSTIDEGNAAAYLAERHPEGSGLWIVAEEA